MQKNGATRIRNEPSRMSALGQERTLTALDFTSALPPKADEIVGKADIGPVAQSTRQPEWLLRLRESDSRLRIDQKDRCFPFKKTWARSNHDLDRIYAR